MTKYDYLIVGAGLFGATFAYEAAKRGKKVKVIEKRDHIAGNIYTKEVDGIQVHQYGAHIFHTSNKEIWNYINQFAEFNRYTNSPVANYKGQMYNLPFNMNTFSEMWGVRTPAEALAKINEQRQEMAGKEPKNLEEQAISLIGRDIYEKLIKGYTEKQWGQKATELPAFIIRRLPVRLTYDNNYFNDLYQGIPIGGYTQIVEKMLNSELIDVETGVDFFDQKDDYLANYPKVVFTGMIDQFFDYQLGELQYRSLRFETEEKNVGNYQGNAVINYTDAEHHTHGLSNISTSNLVRATKIRRLLLENIQQTGIVAMNHTIRLIISKIMNFTRSMLNLLQKRLIMLSLADVLVNTVTTTWIKFSTQP